MSFLPQSARSLTLLAALLLAASSPARAQEKAPDKAPPPKPAPDVILFTNGDQLSGTLERGVGNSIVFKSDMAGEITVTLDKVKELHSSGSFAVLRKDVPVSRKTIEPGTLIYGDGKLTLATPLEAPEVIPSDKIAYIIDQTTYDRELEKKPGPLYGWNGAVNGGATIVRATDYGETLSAGIALVRAIPAVPFLPARNRTSFDLQETYGKLTSPVIPQTTPPTPDAVTLTSIFHSDAERDEYFSPKFFALAQTSFDHNFSQGLNLQQVYGGGIGWTAIKTAKQQLDVKADLHYEKQTFQTPISNLDLIGSTISEAYHRTLPHKLLFTQSLSMLPAWNNSSAYSANVSAALALPVFKRLSLTVSSTDNFLNDPAIGYNKNSFQFITAISYALK
jgi:hypothetical protein